MRALDGKRSLVWNLLLGDEASHDDDDDREHHGTAQDIPEQHLTQAEASTANT